VNRSEGGGDQELAASQGQSSDETELEAVVRAVTDKVTDNLPAGYHVISVEISEGEAAAPGYRRYDVVEPDYRPASPTPLRPEDRGVVEMPPAPVRPEDRGAVDLPVAPVAPVVPVRPHERGVVEMPPAPVRPEDRGAVDLPVAPVMPVRPQERGVVEMPPAPAPPAEQKPVEYGATRLPEPPILVGNPRLGSAPGSSPRAKRSPADSVLDGAQFKNFTVRAASLRGDDHRYNSDPRQDSIGVWAIDRPSWLGSGEDLLLACVADGVGNCPLSHIGSAEACWLLRQHAEAHLAALTSMERMEIGCRRVMADVAGGLRVLAEKNGLRPKDVSTTLVAGLVVPAGKQQGAVASALVFRVGDSPGFLLRERQWISIPKNSGGEEAVHTTGTDALPTRAEMCQVETHQLFAGDMLMLCSDGLSGPMDNNENVRDQLADWWGHQPPSLPEFYWQMSFRAQTYGDDRSAVCVWMDA
jgi:serine/threonine protein phosphatase PrpC